MTPLLKLYYILSEYLKNREILWSVGNGINWWRRECIWYMVCGGKKTREGRKHLRKDIKKSYWFRQLVKKYEVIGDKAYRGLEGIKISRDKETNRGFEYIFYGKVKKSYIFSLY